jgi:hypothetical protein
VNPDIIPSSVIVFEASEKYVIERVKNMTEEEQGAGKDARKKGYTEAEIKARLKEYRTSNNTDDGGLSLADFFKEKAVATLLINIEKAPKEIAMQQSKVFVERVNISEFEYA